MSRIDKNTFHLRYSLSDTVFPLWDLNKIPKMHIYLKLIFCKNQPHE